MAAMFASDQNVETIGRLAEAFHRFARLEMKLARLTGVEKAVRLCTVLLMLVVFLMMTIFAIMFVSAAAVCALEPAMGMVWALLAVAGAHIVLYLLFFLFRKPLIEKPLVKLLMGIFN